MSWKLGVSAAKWEGPQWSASIALANESEKPLIQIFDGSQQPVVSVAVTPSERHVRHFAAGVPFGEAYVRQQDLIAVFPELAPWRFGYQIDMRVLDTISRERLAIEFWLSIQTSLLDSHPQIELRITGEQFSSVLENIWISDSNQIGLLIHPLDKTDCQIEQAEDGIAMCVFGQFMEKGVIRRMRFRLLSSLGPESSSFWRDRFEEFSESPLPLTT